MDGWSLWRYEARRCGRQLWILPVVTAALWFAAPVAYWGAWLTAALVPLTAALCTAAIVARERLVELHLSLPVPLARTVGRRLALVAGLLAAGATALSAGAQVWVTAALLIAVAALAGAATRSMSTASTAVLVAWLGKLLLVDRLLPGPSQVVPLLVVTAVLGWLTVLRLHDGDALIHQEGE
jgi:hypothetical protein